MPWPAKLSWVPRRACDGVRPWGCLSRRRCAGSLMVWARTMSRAYSMLPGHQPPGPAADEQGWFGLASCDARGWCSVYRHRASFYCASPYSRIISHTYISMVLDFVSLAIKIHSAVGISGLVCRRCCRRSLSGIYLGDGGPSGAFALRWIYLEEIHNDNQERNDC